MAQPPRRMTFAVRYATSALFALAIICGATSASADTLSLSGGANRTPSTTGNPTSGSNQSGLTGYFELGPRWTLDAIANWSRPLASRDASSPFAAQEKDAATYYLSLGATWTPGAGETTVTVDDAGDSDTDELPAHWSFSTGVNLSQMAHADKQAAFVSHLDSPGRVVIEIVQV